MGWSLGHLNGLFECRGDGDEIQDIVKQVVLTYIDIGKLTYL